MKLEKWVVLFSRKQNCYHVETESDYLNRPENDYRIMYLAKDRESANIWIQSVKKTRKGLRFQKPEKECPEGRTVACTGRNRKT